MKKIFVTILISVVIVLLFSYKTPSVSTESNIRPVIQKIADSQPLIDTISGSIMDVSSSETFPLPDPIQRRAIAIIIIGSIPVGFIFLIILYRSRRRKIMKKIIQKFNLDK